MESRVGPLIREVQTDVIAEEADRIAKALFTWAKPRIERGVGRAIPMWWKERLAREQFGEVSSEDTTDQTAD